MKLKEIKGEAVLAEFIGTFGLTLAVIISLSSPIFGLPTAVVAAATVGFFVLVIGSISGCHINPAITVGQFTLGKIKYLTAIAYIIAQVSGALLALVIFGLFNNNEIFELGATETWDVFWAEALGAAILGFAVAAAVLNKMDAVASGLTVGGGLLIGIIAASIASNGVLNPAVAVGIGSATWPYIAGPILGAVIGSQTYRILLPAKSKK
jgi:aquaporin Z